MKRFSLVFALALVFAVNSVVFGQRAYDPSGEPLPMNAEPTTTWMLTKEGWVTADTAKSWNSGGAAGHCNRECWSVTLENHVSVAQWLDWSLSGTRKDWRVLKPGTYASDSVTAYIKSNNDVIIKFWAEDPVYLNPDAESPPIPTWYGYAIGQTSSHISDVEDWVRAADYSEDSPLVITLRYEDGLPDGLYYRIFEKIEVRDEHRSSDYHGMGGLLICITNLKFWVDGTEGTFKNPQT